MRLAPTTRELMSLPDSLTGMKRSSGNPLDFPPPTITVWNAVWQTPPLSSPKPLQGSLVKACVGKKKEHYSCGVSGVKIH